LRAQITPAPDPAVVNLARHIAEPLQKEQVTTVFVADLRGPEGQEHPVGKRLADLLSASLQPDFPGLQVLDRRGQRGSRKSIPANRVAAEKRLGAETWGNRRCRRKFCQDSTGDRNLARCEFSSRSPRLRGERNGLIPIWEEIAQVSSNPIPPERSGIARAGIGDATIPGCIRCRPPEFSLR
jgi:hypothetical protein